MNSNAIDPARREAAAAIPPIRRVLVSTDLSPLGNAAIPHAYAVLQPGACVRVVHVETAFEFPHPAHAHDPNLTTVLMVRRAAAMEECRARLRALVPAEAAARGVNTEVEIVQADDPAAAICREAERFAADLICLASHGRSGIARTVFGSVAHAVLKDTHRPVLVVRAPGAQAKVSP